MGGAEEAGLRRRWARDQERAPLSPVNTGEVTMQKERDLESPEGQGFKCDICSIHKHLSHAYSVSGTVDCAGGSEMNQTQGKSDPSINIFQ